jgi:hypothetical protein
MGCSSSDQNESPDKHRTVEGSEWLRGDVDTRFALVAKHLRGFDMAMVEVDCRYGELYWASRDQNRDYAACQLGRIETAVANGVERRPLRVVSGQMLDGAVTQLGVAIDGRDASGLETAIETLTATCDARHQAEHVPYIHVAPPVRLSPVRRGSVPEAERGGSGR